MEIPEVQLILIPLIGVSTCNYEYSWELLKGNSYSRSYSMVSTHRNPQSATHTHTHTHWHEYPFEHKYLSFSASMSTCKNEYQFLSPVLSVLDGLAAETHISLNKIATNMEIGMEIDEIKSQGVLCQL